MRFLQSLQSKLWFMFSILALAVAATFGTNVGKTSAVTPTAMPAPLYQGYFDYVNCTSISGWVRDQNSPGMRLNVFVYDLASGVVVATGTANQFRQDLLNAHIGDGYYGFTITTPASLKDGQSHNLSIIVSNSSFTLGNSPKSFNSTGGGCTAQPAYEGYLDSVTCSAIAGWTWNRNGPLSPLNVEVIENGVVIATGTADQFRQDLANAGFGTGKYGFTITTPASLKNGQLHRISLRVKNTGFILGNSPLDFNSTTAGCSAPTGPVRMTIHTRTAASKHDNFRVQAANFSVTKIQDKYHLFGTGGYDLWRWNSTNTGWDSLYNGGWPIYWANADCSHATDPRLWNPRCTSDAIGLFTKQISCPPGGGVACQDNDRWNGAPGSYNITTFASPTVWPNPHTADFGTNGYSPIMNAGKVNSVEIQPASTDCQQSADTTWVDDFLPTGAAPEGTWKWVYSNPSAILPVPTPTPVSAANTTFSPPPFPSYLSHQSDDFDAIHQHYFTGAILGLQVNAGDKLFAYIYINPNSLPQQVMLQWREPNGDWNHRAFWGADKIAWGVPDPNHPSHKRMSSTIPAAGQWVRLEVDASDVGLVGKTVDGIAFTLFDGQATWDKAGKSKPLPGSKCPPKSWVSPEKSFHAYNRDDFATGADSGKAVQVKYAGGQTKWFMAFNKQIKHVTPTYQKGTESNGYRIPHNPSEFGGSAADNWEILWATSPDGVNWTPHPQMIIRSTLEREQPWLGTLAMDMIVDGGYFYLLFQDSVRPYLYLARAPIDQTYSTTSAGYVTGGWQLACNQIQPNGEYLWKSFPMGEQLDFASLKAYQVMRTRLGGDFNADAKQGAIARITSSTTGATYYFGVTADLRETLQLWKTTSLSKPFQYESDVIIEDSRIDYTPDGWYANFSFNHYPDNNSTTPQLFSAGFDWWMGEQLRPAGATIDGLIVAGRHTASLTGF